MSIATSTQNDRLSFTLGDRLMKALRISGVTREQMAEALGVSPTTVGNYTSDRTKPSKLAIKEWAVRTGVPMGWLSTGTMPAEDDGPDPEGASVTGSLSRDTRL